MSPVLAPNNGLYRRLSYTVLSGKALLAYVLVGIPLTYFTNGVFGQFGVTMIFATLLIGIVGARVLTLRAENEMVRPNARRIPARVSDNLPLRNWTVGKLPSDVRGKHGASGYVGNPAVASCVCVCSPEPTVAGRINVLPEAFTQWLCYQVAAFGKTRSATKGVAVVLDTAQLGRKQLAANGTRLLSLDPSAAGFLVMQLCMTVRAYQYEALRMGYDLIKRGSSVWRPVVFLRSVLMVEMQCTQTAVISAALAGSAERNDKLALLFGGILSGHRNLLCGVAPRAVASSAGALLCLNYSIAKG